MTVRSAPLCAVVVCLAVLSAAASFAQAPPALPPHVVSCTPAAFAANVDVNLTQVSLTFDRPMKTTGPDGFAPLRWLGAYPGIGGRKALPTWNADGTVVSLPVKLEADMTYAVTINANAKQAFTDPTGAVALPFTWVFSTGARTPADFPAYVVSSVPAPAATDVDPATQQISVTFSRPIAPAELWLPKLITGGVSPEAAPHRGRGRHERGVKPTPLISLSADRLTATIQVSLAPGTVYALSINSAFVPAWKDTLGRPVLPYAWCFRTTGTPAAAAAGGPAPAQ